MIKKNNGSQPVVDKLKWKVGSVPLAQKLSFEHTEQQIAAE